jgi:hypothetical protein
MKTLVNIEKMNAWIKATNTSIQLMNNVNGIAMAEPAIDPPTLLPALPNTKIKQIKLKQ